jgi:hypothetical protein
MGTFIEIYSEEFDFNKQVCLELNLSDEESIQLDSVIYENGQLYYAELNI